MGFSCGSAVCFGGFLRIGEEGRVHYMTQVVFRFWSDRRIDDSKVYPSYEGYCLREFERSVTEN